MSWKENKPIVILVTALLAVCFWMASCIVFTATAKADHISREIATGTDDAGLFETFFSNSEYSLYMGRSDAPNANAYYRFTNITIAAGSVIDACTLVVDANASTSTATCNIRIYFEDTASAATFGASLGSRGKTTANAVFNAVAAWTSGTSYVFAGLQSVLQEVIDRGDWASGNAIVVMVEDNSSTASGAYRRAGSWEYNNDGGGTDKPRLGITFHEGAVPATPSGKRRKDQMQIGSLEPRFEEWTQWETVQ